MCGRIRSIFELDEDLRPIHIAGVPPDYFSPTGQRWGNPLYRWDVLRARGFDWWIDRIRRSRELYDLIRLDHFRGFEAYWSIPADEETAINGTWVKAPGLELFRALEARTGAAAAGGRGPGLITPEVDALRMELGMPGMRVLQFGFGDKGAHIHLAAPVRARERRRIRARMITTRPQGGGRRWERRSARPSRRCVGPVNNRPTWPLIRAAAGSVAEIAIVPAQDLLELGSEARMNTPAVAQGNWSWRVPEGSWTAELAARVAAIVDITDRDNDPLQAGDAASGETRG